MAHIAADFEVEQRIQIDDHKATVRFIGPIESQTGQWIGLEWDELARGKHDGEHKGRRYFKTHNGANSGSFVREEKLRASANCGITLLDALKRKYEASADCNEAALKISNSVTFQLVGMAKLKQQRGGIERLQEVSLQDSAVASAGQPGELSSQAPLLEDLDLSCNLLWRWRDIMQICQELSCLHTLNLSGCRVQPLHSIRRVSCPALQKLVLNGCGIGFSQAMSLLPTFPRLAELHLADNGLTDLTFDSDPAEVGLQVLDLEGNNISSWEEVCRLQQLPRLERLLLGNNNVGEILYPVRLPGRPPPFQSLTALLIGHNRLTGWQAIDSCHQFPALSSLRVTGNPHPAETSGSRFEVVARVEKLKLLNGSTISSSERKESEVQFLREVAGRISAENGVTLSSGQGPLDIHLQRRVDELKERYGDVGAAVKPNEGPKALGADMLEVRLTQTSNSRKTITKRLPGTLTIGRLKLLCSKLFKGSASRTGLCLVIDDVKEDITECDTKDLSSFAAEVLHIEVDIG